MFCFGNQMELSFEEFKIFYKPKRHCNSNNFLLLSLIQLIQIAIESILLWNALRATSSHDIFVFFCSLELKRFLKLLPPDIFVGLLCGTAKMLAIRYVRCSNVDIWCKSNCTLSFVGRSFISRYQIALSKLAESSHLKFID